MIGNIEREQTIPRPAAQNPSMGNVPSSSDRTKRRPRMDGARSRYGLVLSLLALFCFPATGAISLSHQEAMRIGRKIWENECGGTISGLTSWNAGENFASLGIGHFIWYPAGQRGPFDESFPKFVRYVERRGAKLPELLLGGKSKSCPWNSQSEFVAAASSPQMKQLRIFLTDTIDLQADFMVERLREALPRMWAAGSPERRARIEKNFNRLAGRPQGCYALIDYVNFKGEGVLLTERYKGQGWGLLQVLAGMAGENGDSALNEFADSAERVLRQRVQNAPPERNEQRWLPGWLNRVASYRA